MNRLTAESLFLHSVRGNGTQKQIVDFFYCLSGPDSNILVFIPHEQNTNEWNGEDSRVKWGTT